MPHLAFATFAPPGVPARQAALLAASLRSFGGSLAASPIWVLAPDTGEVAAAEAGVALSRLGVEVLGLPDDPASPGLPFSRKVAAAAAAEARARGTTELLAWLDPDTLVLREPAPFLLPTGAALGYRPVHHRLVGIEWGRPVDAFWEALWRAFGIPAARQFPMTSSVGERLRPYLNAGVLVVRPERGLLAAWQTALATAAADPVLAEHVRRGGLHAVFLHQAVLTAVALAALAPTEMVDLGPGVNYPLHLHDEVPAGLRPALVDDLITARGEETLADPVGRARLPMTPALRRWLEQNLPAEGA